MIQSGDPTGTGKGGQSIWGEYFPVRFDLKFDGEKENRIELSFLFRSRMKLMNILK